jgi:uncharacterized protein YciI
MRVIALALLLSLPSHAGPLAPTLQGACALGLAELVLPAEDAGQACVLGGRVMSDKQWYITVIRPVRPAMVVSGPDAREAPLLEAHFQYMMAGAAAERVVFIGRTVDASRPVFGQFVHHAANPAEAEAFAAADPAIAAGVFRAETQAFKVVHLGTSL